MSSEPPPQPISDTFNQADWNRDQNLTIAEATKRYLSKVLNDTAAGVITFLQGIITNSISATTSGSTLLIGNNVNAGNISIGANVNAFGSILLGGGLAGLSNIYAGYLSVTNLITNNITPIGVGDTMTVGASTSTMNVNSPTTFSQTVSANTIATTTDASSLAIASNQTTGHMYIGNSFSRTGSINIGARAFFPSNNTINIGTSSYTTSITGTVNIGRGSTTNIGTLTSSTVNIGTTAGVAISIGSSSTTLSVASAANFTALPTVSASYFSVPSADTSNTIITANWINAIWLPYLLGLPNIWGGSQTFATLPVVSASYGSVPGNDVSNIVVNTTWINTVWSFYFVTLSNIWTAVQIFSALPTSTGSYASITGANTSNTIITANWINSTWLPYLRGLANTWTLLQTFTAGISCTLPIRVTYAPSSITVNTMIGYRYAADVSSVTVTSTRRCQCVLNGTAGVGAVLPAGVYTVSYVALLNTTTAGYLAGIVVRPTITNGSTSATGGVLNLYGGLLSRVQSTTAPFYITGSTTVVLDGTDCVSIGIESTTTQSANCDMWCQAIRIA